MEKQIEKKTKTKKNEKNEKTKKWKTHPLNQKMAKISLLPDQNKIKIFKKNAKRKKVKSKYCSIKKKNLRKTEKSFAFSDSFSLFFDFCELIWILVKKNLVSQKNFCLPKKKNVGSQRKWHPLWTVSSCNHSCLLLRVFHVTSFTRSFSSLPSNSSRPH